MNIELNIYFNAYLDQIYVFWLIIMQINKILNGLSDANVLYPSYPFILSNKCQSKYIYLIQISIEIDIESNIHHILYLKNISEYYHINKSLINSYNFGIIGAEYTFFLTFGS